MRREATPKHVLLKAIAHAAVLTIAAGFREDQPDVSNSELGQQVRRELCSRLSAGGWRLLESRADTGFDLAEFECRLTDEFTAVALIDCEDANAAPLVVNSAAVGVAYEPLRGLASMLEDYVRPARAHVLRSAIVAYDVIFDLDEHGNIRDEEDEPAAEQEGWRREIVSGPDAATVAQELADLILHRGVPCADHLAEVDALIARLEHPGSIDWRVPALLTAAKRLSAAADAVSALEALEGGPTPYIHQLRRLIEGQSTLS